MSNFARQRIQTGVTIVVHGMGDSKSGLDGADRAQDTGGGGPPAAMFAEIWSAWSAPATPASTAPPPDEVTYPDGSVRKFAYRDDGSLAAVKDPDKPVARHSHKDGRWDTPVKVHQFGLDYYETVSSYSARSVSADGTYTITDHTTVPRYYKPDGTKWAGDFELSTMRSFLRDRPRFFALYEKHADEIDSNHDGLLSKQEVEASATDPWDRGSARKLLATGMSQVFITLTFLARDRGQDGKAVSRADMDWYRRASAFGDRSFLDNFRNPGLILGPIGALVWDHFEGYGDEHQRLETLSERLDKDIERAIKRIDKASD